ncbi:hypothetical protein [Lentzea sp. NPDC059081]|uniref:hypothetical protein n=1 Tax=Lentzea sp. NPDC059081 TaxID=3346719 RepID=UPI003688249C
MKTARQIRQELRAEERQRRQLRERAVLALSSAGAAALRVSEVAEHNKQALRERLERDLAAEDAKVDAAELAAGRAVAEATSGADLGAIGATFREAELHNRTGIQVAVLRRWMRRVREDEEQASRGAEERPSGIGGVA